MVAAGESIVHELSAIYDTGGDVDLPGFVSTRGPLADDLLADLIELDARRRESLGRPVRLDRYLAAFPDLALRPVPLDTAIIAALRSLAGGRSAPEAAADLMRSHPGLAESIRLASALNEALRSTAGLLRAVDAEEAKALPCDFGPALPTGRPRYELREMLGRGAHGAVYLAADRQLSAPHKPAWVAIKLIACRESPRERQRLVEEATKARMVDHEHVVRVVDLGFSSGGEVYVVFEHVAGGTLEGAVKRRSDRVPPREAATIMAAVAHGIQAAHSVGLAHCDLKPTNILMTEAGEPKVADFGVAVREGRDEPVGAAGEAGRIGSLAFMAPEQYRMEPNGLSCAADIYAAGGILFWLLTGELPNGATAPEVARNLSRPGRRTPPDVRAHRREIDPDLAAICGRAMATDPRDRYASAESLACDLEAFIRMEPLPWRAPSSRRRAALFVRRQPLLAAGVLLGLAGVVGGVIIGAAALNRAEKHRLEGELRVSEERLNVELKKSEVARDRLAAGMRFSEKVKMGRAEDQWLPTLTILESVLANSSIIGPDGVDVWSDRISVARKLIDRAVVDGRDRDVDILLWEITEGYWLLCLDRHEEASELLTRNRQKLAEVLRPTDRILKYNGALLACAAGIKAIKDTEAVDKDRRDPAALVRAASDLEQVDGVFTPGLPHDPVVRLSLSVLARLYARPMLDDPNALRHVLDLQDAGGVR